jgi:HNH endonuclease
MSEKKMSKEELLIAIRKIAEELERSPTRDELAKRGVSRKMIARWFSTQREAFRACNLTLSPYGRRLSMHDLFVDWAEMVRELKALPNYLEYTARSKYSTRPLKSRYKSWKRVPMAMRQHIYEQGLTAEWADVLEVIERETKCEPAYQEMLENGVAPKVLMDRPMYGKFLRVGPMVCAPVNESGVLVLFGAMAERLGFLILRVQSGFPDIEAWRIVGPDRLQRVRIEAEFQSRNFIGHGHDPKGCDLIVCWEHNWPDCPVEVIELSRLVENVLG